MCSTIQSNTQIMCSPESHEDGSGWEEEQRGTKRKIALSNCGICGSDEAKYRCPACLTHSCSLLCVNKHKEDSGCSGVRNKTAFVTLSHFDEMALLNDYRLLEDTSRFADGATRDKLIRTPHVTSKAKVLTSNAQKKHITLKLLPITFTRSKENSTIFHKKEKQFLWHLKLIFPQSSSEFTERRVSEKQTLEQILTAYIHPTESDPVKRQKLKMYVQAPPNNMKVFMKAEGGKANSVRYHELELEKSLGDNLSFKTLLEYPVLHVVLKDHWKEYPPRNTARPAAACTGPAAATKNAAVADPERKEVQHTTTNTKALQERKGEREEGEITESSTEEEEEDGSEDANTPRDRSCDVAASPPEDTEAMNSVSEVSSPSKEDKSALRESAEVSMTKEDAAKEPPSVHSHPNESAE